ncbi:lipid-A-disaccharide synthase [candidate division KSB1 bacterium]|nr:lipid-A-disaccharide synthase [candidate division KSB1 bacterium]
MSGIMIIAGEASGDLHGGRLVQALLQQNPDLAIYGVGGDHMAAAGMKLFYHIDQLAYIGFVEVIKHYFFFRRVFRDLLRVLDSQRPDVVVLIDYPGFNLRFARRAKKRGMLTFYYIAPQVWAWGQGRAQKMAKYIDEMAVIFKFEVAFFSRFGIQTTFVGHPLLESLNPPADHTAFFARYGLKSDKPILAILPGSRKQEVTTLMPLLYHTVKILRQRHPDIQIAISKASTISLEFLAHHHDGLQDIKIIESDLHSLLNCATAGMVASGTATLEAAIFRLPFIIVYRVAKLSYLLAKRLIKIPYIGLVNVVAGEPVIKEFLQNNVNPEMLAREMERLLYDQTERTRIVHKLQHIKTELGEVGASQKTAQLILKLIK